MKTIPLTRGQVAQVDDADYEWLMQWKWYATPGRKTFYARHSSGKRRIGVKMHRILVDAREGELVDHRDGNGLNNQRHNLRVCDALGSSRNRGLNKVPGSSAFKGVRKVDNGWEVRIRAEQKRHRLLFANEREAALAYDALALKYHGEFARTNAMLGLLPRADELADRLRDEGR